MTRIVGDAMVAGAEECEPAPEMVTVRITRGQAEALASSAEQVRDLLKDVDESIGEPPDYEVEFLSRALSDFRAQIGGSR
jgi:hypothetical protein